jgi:hypothetical protein
VERLMPVSVISNTIVDVNGDAVVGARIIARLKPGPGFRVTEGTELAPETETETDANGLWSLALERNSNISPAGTSYEIEEQIPDAIRFWPIQVGDANATLQASIVSPLPEVTAQTYLTQEAADARYQALGSFGGSPRVVRATANATAGVATSAVRSDEVPSLHDEIAGDALIISGGILAFNPDGSTLEISADAARIKDAGVTRAKHSAQMLAGFFHYSLFQAGVR